MRKRTSTAARTPRKRTPILRQPRSADDFYNMTADGQETWKGVLDALAAMRSKGHSLQHAARDAGISPATVLRLAGSAIRKRSGGRYVVAASDSLLRVVVLPTPTGLTEVSLRSSKDASLLGEYFNAVHRYLSTGDASGLARFDGVTIRSANGERLSLVTDRPTLDRLGSAGVLSFESIYSR